MLRPLRVTLALMSAGIATLPRIEASASPLLSIDLVWSGTTGVGTLGSSAIQVSAFEPETLTLDIVLGIGPRGLDHLQVSARFDTDLQNELNLSRAQTFSWASPNGSRRFDGFGFHSSQESESDNEGQILALQGLSPSNGPVNTTLTFARVVFVTNPSNVRSDDADIGTGFFLLGDIAYYLFDIFPYRPDEIAFGSASVDVIPEPSSLVLLALGIGALVLARRS